MRITGWERKGLTFAACGGLVCADIFRGDNSLDLAHLHHLTHALDLEEAA